MLDFRPMTLGDYAWMKELQEASEQTACEYLPGNIFLWGGLYGTQICRLNDDSFATYSALENRYCFPTGRGDPEAALKIIMRDANERGVALRMFGISDNNRRTLDELFPGLFTYSESRDWADYVYNAEDLINLPGKKYHAKRNHIAAFDKSHRWTFEPLNEHNISACVDFQEQWFAANESKNPQELAQENTVVISALRNFFALGFVGGVLFADGKVAGFTIGERINGEIFCTHIEKADGEIRGAYPMLNRQFARSSLADYRYINREEDTGDEGLRRAKLSYYPAFTPMEYAAIMI
ncbi:MAG: phosphatidylglycerol lysyltransferase domain-containing protein [Oscillospiraceae bacterium]|jgi:hypothetical protein|nr:phosphatidylglycerol lysyltransferase domain-containing protein [Oscillospiraceae bacterium]